MILSSYHLPQNTSSEMINLNYPKSNKLEAHLETAKNLH